MTNMNVALAFAAALGAVTPAVADDQPVVVELYTSQGCSSCPPADALLQELAQRKDVLPLALHVDYWDYIGWKDTFGNPGFTRRQRGYAQAAGHRTIYTPQMVVAGEDHVIGYRPMDLVHSIEVHLSRPHQADIVLNRTGDEVHIAISPDATLSGDFVVQLVRYLPYEQVSIERGENAGQTIDYHNVVTDWQRLAEWDGSAPLSLTAPAAGDQPLAVILQHAGYGPIVAAAALR